MKWGTGVSTVSNLKDGFQVAMDLANAANRAGDVAKLIDTQQQVLNVLDENRKLNQRVAELEDELATNSQLIRKGLEYYIGEDDGTQTGPVCPGCYKRDRIVSGLMRDGRRAFCQRCREWYNV